MGRWSVLLSLAILFAGNAVAKAAALEERLHLRGGQTLNGTSRGVEEGVLIWEFAPDGVLRVPFDLIERLEMVPELPPEPEPPLSEKLAIPPAPSAPADGPAKPDDPAAEVPPWTDQIPFLSTAIKPAVKIYDGVQQTAFKWTRSVTLGGTFIYGNARTDTVNLASQFEQNTPEHSRQVDFGGQWARNHLQETVNRWWINTNFDWTMREAFEADIPDKWILFLTSKNEYNGLANLNYRGTVSLGAGYRFVFDPKNAKRRLIVRFGPAFTSEFYHDPYRSRLTPDMFGEAELRWPLFDRTAFEQKLRVQPNMADFELVRVFSTTALNIDLDEKDRWKLRLSVQTEYISIPNPGRKPTDITSILSIVYQRR